MSLHQAKLLLIFMCVPPKCTVDAAGTNVSLFSIKKRTIIWEEKCYKRDFETLEVCLLKQDGCI